VPVNVALAPANTNAWRILTKHDAAPQNLQASSAKG